MPTYKPISEVPKEIPLEGWKHWISSTLPSQYGLRFIGDTAVTHSTLGWRVYYQCHRSGTYKSLATVRGPKKTKKSGCKVTLSVFFRHKKPGVVTLKFNNEPHSHPTGQKDMIHMPIPSPIKQTVERLGNAGLLEGNVIFPPMYYNCSVVNFVVVL